MAMAALVGSVCSGHGCHPPRASVASTNTTFFIEGRAAHVVGDSWSPHACGEDIHGGIVASGSSNFFIAGRPMARMGDGIAGDAIAPCGSLIAANCSTNFIVGG
jgi:uncharacterized Zn-binding protein involved in type VI secretion